MNAWIVFYDDAETPMIHVARVQAETMAQAVEPFGGKAWAAFLEKEHRHLHLLAEYQGYLR